MPEIFHPDWREELTVNIEGGIADQHELDAEVLGNSLLSLSKLAVKASSFVYGKECKVSVKVKGGFREGSFDYKLVFDFFGGLLPVVPELTKSLLKLIELKKFLNGEKPVSTEKHGSDIVITNANGDTKVVAPNIVVMNNSAPVTVNINGAYEPLQEGANRMTLKGAITFPGRDGQPALEEAATVGIEEKQAVLAKAPGILSQEDSQKILEVLTPHMDGKPENWRFYDLEDETEYSALVEDAAFLDEVREGRQMFQHGSKVNATVRVVKKLVNERKRTERTIMSLSALADADMA